MTTPLKGALLMAERGEYLFPCVPNAKNPLIEAWEQNASNDPVQIHRWATEYPGCNWGWALGRTNLTAIDVDCKKGALGLESYQQLENDFFEFLPTWKQRTPSKGFHLVYEGATRCTQSTIRAGIDTRSTGGYILCPESVVGKNAYVVEEDLPFAEIMRWVVDAIGTGMERNIDYATCLCDWDLDHNVARFVEHLKNHPDVPDGERNTTTLKVAHFGRDVGVSDETCLELMTEHFLPKCAEGDDFGFERTVYSAYKTAKRPAGCESLEELNKRWLDLGEEVEHPPEHDWTTDMGTVECLSIPKREWILGRRYIKSYITVTISPGGIGKSTLTILEALAIRTGKELTGEKVHAQGKVWIYSTEDPRDELYRRVHAAAKVHGITDLSGIYVSSGRDDPMILAKDTKGRIEINKLGVKRMIDKCLALGIVHMVIDPFVRTHQVSENDNMAIDKVMQALQRICSKAGISISLVHHTSKAGSNAAGDMNAARGASSMISAARIAHTLVNATEAELKNLKGITSQDLNMIIRLDDAKANLSPPGASTQWFRRVSVDLGQGDKVGSLELIEAVPKERVLVGDDLKLRDDVFLHYTKPITANALAKHLKAHAGYVDDSVEGLRKAILRVFDPPQTVGSTTLGVSMVSTNKGDAAGIIDVNEEF